jgi:hypothetical protein
MTKSKITKPNGAANAPGAPNTADKPSGKIGLLIDLLERPGGASLQDMQAATGWQAHSVRGAIAGSIKKKRGLAVTSDKSDGARIYRIVEAQA